MDSVIKLITERQEQDANGIFRPVLKSRQVFCKVSSVGAREFFDAGRNGLNPEFRFIVFANDYNGERTLEFEKQTYAIYRTFRINTDYLEIYVERKGGTNGL